MSLADKINFQLDIMEPFNFNSKLVVKKKYKQYEIQTALYKY